MKLNRNVRFNFFTFFVIAALAMISPCVSRAQNNGLYPLYNYGGINVIPAQTTNVIWCWLTTNGVPTGVITTNLTGVPGTPTNITLNISEYDYNGITASWIGNTGSTNGVIGIQAFPSYDYGTTWNTAPLYSVTNIPAATAGATQFTFGTNWDVHGVTTLGFNVLNAAPALGWASNFNFKVNLKAPSVKIQPASNPGTTPGRPIVVPNQ